MEHMESRMQDQIEGAQFQFEQDETEIIDLVSEFAAKNPHQALSLLTGLFVGLVEHSVKDNGGDPLKQIVMEGGSRKLTIHAAGA